MVGVRQFDEKAVIRQALELFWHQGPAATSMPDLSQATLVHRGSLYNAFGDKETIFLEAFSLYSRNFLSTASSALSGPTAFDVLVNFFNLIISNMTQGNPPRGCLTTKTAVDGSISEPRVLFAVRELITNLELVVSRSLEKYSDQLLMSPVETASLVVVFTRGLAVMERIRSDETQLRQLSLNFSRSLVFDID